MEIYLPIAGISENMFVIIGLGAGVGLISGTFGVGGGFLLTPLLIQLGIPPPVAVASAANQVFGASVSGCLAHWQRNNVDLKMGMIMLVAGLVGSSIGIWIFRLLQMLGQIDLAISLCYVVLLGALGILMLIDGLQIMFRRRKARGSASNRGVHRHIWLHHLPLKMRFKRSGLYISSLVPVMVGLLVGLLSAIMGVGGGFVLVPAMIYLVGMPSSFVVGTSLFQITFVSANVTFLQAVTNQTVDVLLVLLLLVGGTVGAQIGTRLGAKLRTDQLRILLALMVLTMSMKMLNDLTVTPEDIYSLSTMQP